MKKYLAVGVLAFTTGLMAQNTVPMKHQGCMMTSPDDSTVLLLAEGSSCTMVTGKFAKSDLLGHTIIFEGFDIAATATEPQSTKVQKVISVGAACHQVCTLEPPGHRGLHKKEKPGSQGGTPGQ